MKFHAIATLATLLILAPAYAVENEQSPEAPAQASHVSIAFSGESVADRGLLGAVSKYIFEHRIDRSCQSFEAVHASQVPMVASGGFPRRSKEDNLRDDVYEIWDVTMCGTKQKFMVRFAFAKGGGIDYWVNPTRQ
jgi:hypothetical protein